MTNQIETDFGAANEVQTEFDLTTRQGIFDHVATALMKQGRPAIASNGACLYQAADGCRCAVGHLLTTIPDDKIEEVNDSGSVSELDSFRDHDALRLVDRRVPRTRASKSFLERLQAAHDEPAVGLANDVLQMENPDWLPEWKGRMRQLAAFLNLDPAVLDNSADVAAA